MPGLIECVPNFSEGRRPEVLDAIAASIASVPGVIVLGREMDADHHRAVVTFAGPPEAVGEAAFHACARAAELINLETHRGVHPRIGATDVIPFVPLEGVSMATCIRVAHDLGARIAAQLGIPAYLYGAAARRPEREHLADVRKGQYEGLKTRIATDPSRYPDCGEPRLHPTAGAVAVGARNPLIAYNVNLRTTDVRVARRVAKSVRERDGGLKGVRALGFALKSRGLVQVSMNLTDPAHTSIAQAFERVEHEAKRAGVAVVESEIVGLVPLKAVLDPVVRHLRLTRFGPSRIVERRIWEAEKEG